MVRAPAGTCTDAAGPTSAMRPSRITIVWSGFGPAPVPSTRSTWVSATVTVSTTTYWRTSVASESGRWDGSAAGASVTKPSVTSATRRMRDSSLFHGEGHHHPSRQMFGDVAVQHPATGVGSVEQNIHRGTGRHQHCFFPCEVVFRHSVHRDHEEPLAVQVVGVLHPVEPQSLVDEPELHRVARMEPPVDVHVLPARGGVTENPMHLPAGGCPIHHRHRAAPLDGGEVDRVELHQPLGHRREPLGLESEDERLVGGAGAETPGQPPPVKRGWGAPPRGGAPRPGGPPPPPPGPPPAAPIHPPGE